MIIRTFLLINVGFQTWCQRGGYVAGVEHRQPLTEMTDSQLDAICEEVVKDLKDLDFSI